MLNILGVLYHSILGNIAHFYTLPHDSGWVLRYTFQCLSICLSIWILSPYNSSYSFHQIALELGGQLDHEMVQRILFFLVMIQQISIELFHVLKI